MPGQIRQGAKRVAVTIDMHVLEQFDALPPHGCRGQKLEKLMRAAVIRAKLHNKVPEPYIEEALQVLG